MKCMWEILVPTVRNNGKPYRTRYHRVWDAKVRAIAGGLTILTPAKGQWISTETDTLYIERMIPVRIACTREEILKIAEFSKKYYDQERMLVFKITDEVMFV